MKFIPKHILARLLMIPLLLSLSGCVYLVVGGIGALGGYVVSPDTVEGVTGHDVKDVWDAAVEVVSIMGTVNEQQEQAGILIARVNGCKVTITISQLADQATKVRIKSRKAFLPKITVSQEVYVKIMSKLTH